MCTAGAGFTDHTTETMHGQAKQIMMQTLSPEIKKLINTDIMEKEHQESWLIAMGKVEYQNLCQARESHAAGDVSPSDASHNHLMYALTGEPDEEFPVQPAQWRDYVFKTDLFQADGKWNGSCYTRAQLEKILGRKVRDDEVSDGH
jgi:hypothetical protein